MHLLFYEFLDERRSIFMNFWMNEEVYKIICSFMNFWMKEEVFLYLVERKRVEKKSGKSEHVSW
jgi:hypothetical protein